MEPTCASCMFGKGRDGRMQARARQGWSSSGGIGRFTEAQVGERRRVAITGIGAVTPIGTGREGLWDGMRAERSAVGRLTRFDPTIFRSHNAAEVNDFVADRSPRGEAREAARPLRPVLRRRRAAWRSRTPASTSRRGSRAHRRDDGHRARRRRLRRGAARASSSAQGLRAVDPTLALARVRRRVELQHRHRVRRHGPELAPTR